MGDNYPRVLFLTSAAFNKVTGGGITFTNLFTGWPRDSIATVHNDPVPVTTEVCSQYYRLGEAEIHRLGWLRHIPLGKAAATVDHIATTSANRSWSWALLKRIKTWIFGDAIPEIGVVSPQLAAWVNDFRPTIIYTILGSNAMMELAEQLRVRFQLPLVVHIMDDWVSVLYRGGLFSLLLRRHKERLMKHLMDVASARLVICDAMASAYQKRYKKSFMAFQNTIDVAAWKHYAKQPAIVGKPLRVAYIGSIFPFAQLDSLADVCMAVQQLNDEGLAIRMEIYSPSFLAEQYRTRLVVGNAVQLLQAIQDDKKFFATLQSVDVLVLPVNFDDYTRSYIRYSMPTKVPAYLAIGTPILAYGPAEAAQIAYASTGWGYTVTERSLSSLRDALLTLVTDEELRCRLSRKARQLAAERHDIGIVRKLFQDVLFTASRHHMVSQKDN